MKKVFIAVILTVIICCSVFFLSCYIHNQFSLHSCDNKTTSDDVSFWIDNNTESFESWENGLPFPPTEREIYIKDKETALSVASTVFYANYPHANAYKPDFIHYLANIGVYIVGFSEPVPEGEEPPDGGGMAVAINEQNGEILHIYPEE